MAEIKFCKGGQMQGLYVHKKEMQDIAAFLKRKHGDEIVPLPDKTPEEQSVLVLTCDHKDAFSGHAGYWETELGTHGWYCKCCGYVVQWG